MNFTILIPHFRNGKATAYCIYQLLKNKGKHDIDIVVIDNCVNDKSAQYFMPFAGAIEYVAHPAWKLQSHGLAFEYALEKGYVHTRHFITIESDSFPTNDTWLDYYEDLINKGHDYAGSLLRLSGGTFIHPCGAMYSSKVWAEAKKYCDEIEYEYFPNMSRRQGFDCHLMVHHSIVLKFLTNPEDYIELAIGYRGLTKDRMLERAIHYSPTKGVFHNGMGKNNESIKTYGERHISSEANFVILDNKSKLINRIGEEPGQWFSAYHVAKDYSPFCIPTEVKWMQNRENQQQEYTLMENGFKHIWCGSSYLDMKGGDYNDVYEFKQNQIDELYNSLPNNLKIKPDAD